jgi:4-hydroxy-2-oxoheptanedioate aldolase
MMRENTIRKIWSQGGCVVNGWLHIPDGFASEVMAHQGWDSLTIDTQHGPVDFQAAVSMLQAIATTNTMPMARVLWNDPGMIMRLLDAGCFGIICPMVNTREECEAFVGACRYPPKGYRSYGPTRVSYYAGDDYAPNANDSVITMAMIETRQAVENLDAILSVPGLDSIYIGPSDLAQSHGYPPKADPTDEAVVSIIDHILERARAHNIVVGIHCGSPSYARAMADKGMQFVTIQSDARLMAAAAKQAVAAFRGETAQTSNKLY